MITTERLFLRRPGDEDIDPLAAMNSDPEVMRYIGDGSTAGSTASSASATSTTTARNG